MTIRWRSVEYAPLLCALLGCGGSTPPVRAYAGPELPGPQIARLSQFLVIIDKIDGQAPPPCDHCELALKPGPHRFQVRYWRTGFVYNGPQVVFQGEIAPAAEEELLVKSRSARELTATLLPGHHYYLFGGTNLAFDDWYVELWNETAQATIVSDRSAHCNDCEPPE